MKQVTQHGRALPLWGKVAVVTGSSWGIGRGIALVLEEQGATVYVTGRLVTPGQYYLPGTVGYTAVGCDRRGGRGIPVQVDHADDDQVAEFFARVRSEKRRLHLLVNNAFQLSEDLIDQQLFWAKPLSDLEMLNVSERANYNLERNQALKERAATNPAKGCSFEFPGQKVSALAADTRMMEQSGGTFISAKIATEYGITDTNGKIVSSVCAERGLPISSLIQAS